MFIRNAIVNEIDEPPNAIEIISRFSHEFFSFKNTNEKNNWIKLIEKESGDHIKKRKKLVKSSLAL